MNSGDLYLQPVVQAGRGPISTTMMVSETANSSVSKASQMLVNGKSEAVGSSSKLAMIDDMLEILNPREDGDIRG